VIGELGEPLPAEEQAARKKAYLDTFYKAKADKTMGDIRYKQNLERIKSPEFKAAVQERSRLANEAKRKRDYEAGAGFRSFKADNQARRDSVNTLNNYNRSIGLLQQAYTKALRSGDFEKAFQLSERIQKEKANVPSEMGARQKYFKEEAIRSRNEMVKEQEKQKKLKQTNPDS
jgi:hypothetical protein